MVRKAFRYRLYPTAEQALRLRAWEDALRFLWNRALEQRQMGLQRRDRRYYTAFDQIGERTELRAELPWLADVPRNVCAQLLVELDKAWQRCLQRLARAPRFKRKQRDVLGLIEPHPRVWRLEGPALRFPKLGNLRTVVHRPLQGKPKTCTVRRDGDQWFASIACEIDTPEPPARNEPVVALDRGIVNRIADSDGALVQSPAFGERMKRRLARAQRTVSRRKKGSKNREKAKRRVARLHRTLARQRDQFAHTLSAAYAKSHGTVVVEKLQIQNMVRAHRGLARRILDSTWGRLLECLRYKLEWSGGQLVEVPAHSSSQTCHRCGAVDARGARRPSFAASAVAVRCRRTSMLRSCSKAVRIARLCLWRVWRSRPPSKQETAECPKTFRRRTWACNRWAGNSTGERSVAICSNSTGSGGRTRSLATCQVTSVCTRFCRKPGTC
jgi:putative transposase